MDMISWTISLCTGLFLMTSLVETQRILLRPGRHVCREDKIILVPVTRMKKVCTPFYQRSYRPCNKPNHGLCIHVRHVYRTEFRRVTEMVPQRHAYFICCPGWTGYDIIHNTCNTPVCVPTCQHGGNCSLPNRCVCPDGWNGNSCLSDIDECASSPCDQKCINTEGSFRCECFQGYRLALDGYNCSLCLSCTDEFTNILQDQKRLQKTIDTLEEHNLIIMKNLSSLHKDLSTLTSLPRPVTPTPSPTPEMERSTVDGITVKLDSYMASISEQIGMLEERLDVCTCNQPSSTSRVVMGEMKHGVEPVQKIRTTSTLRRLKHYTDITTKPSPHKQRLTTPLITTTEEDFLPLRTPSK